MSNPEISVIIPTYNRADMICRSIESCLRENTISVEIVVVDDGSIDNTKDVLLKEYKNILINRGSNSTEHGVVAPLIHKNSSNKSYFPKIRYFYQHNQGVCSARNFGLKSAEGDYVKFLDSDDELIMLAPCFKN